MEVNVDNHITKHDFFRIMETDASSLEEYLWLYLYGQGLINVPVSWRIELLGRAIGMMITPFIQWCIDRMVRICPTSATTDPAMPRGRRLSDEEYGRRLADQMNETPSQ